MKKILWIVLSLLLVTACGNGGQKKVQPTSEATETKMEDANTVYVYYFHGKQRCMTCNAVEKVVKEAIEANYASNAKVKFMPLSTDDKANEALVEKYEISWNGLIIDKGGNNSINITEQAFANAVNNPDVLIELLKSEVADRLN
ncbi:MAG: hypothetical protein KA519_03705 [Bacteroides sp.]|uniref:nitrophenyl compound nitroreductase subunit ArsF family protein n=1 Tax=Bacteroides sp. TaxID=29523 RepID=UPI001B7829B4|nr:nitrophenyl compound nitroreductase subunit ArsF family protein [Bacteroides sp.]MBP6064694.1 hypothetical protein [Bacteroides sp.]MBP6067168.1 hypothetical protein [Bacteroides sp.]MBP8621925.1 hypothetical protein [Bacteroides sp.]MBP9585426.1 hypothetical protein [Bacteroides sp.]